MHLKNDREDCICNVMLYIFWVSVWVCEVFISQIHIIMLLIPNRLLFLENKSVYVYVNYVLQNTRGKNVHGRDLPSQSIFMYLHER